MVLSAVFIPSALQPGATGIIYAQFALTIAVSMGFSAFLAMSFTPSLCAAILKPEHETKKGWFYRWFDRSFDWTSKKYLGHAAKAVTHAPRWMVVFVLVVVLTGFLYTKLPTSFVPDEDQGFVLALINLPPGSTLQRTNHVMGEVRHARKVRSAKTSWAFSGRRVQLCRHGENVACRSSSWRTGTSAMTPRCS